MWLQILMIVAGIALVLWGADRLTDGAVALAERMKIPQIVIGLTIVALGTSAPEFCVSLVSALKGTADLAVGNVVGSNIFNTLLIVGVAAMVSPMTILPSTVKKDIPIAVISSFILAIMVLADGDYALACSEGSFGGVPTTYYDLFRVENGFIAEHWDVMETLAAKETWQNQNGKF